MTKNGAKIQKNAIKSRLFNDAQTLVIFLTVQWDQRTFLLVDEEA